MEFGGLSISSGKNQFVPAWFARFGTAQVAKGQSVLIPIYNVLCLDRIESKPGCCMLVKGRASSGRH